MIPNVNFINDVLQFFFLCFETLQFLEENNTNNMNIIHYSFMTMIDMIFMFTSLLENAMNLFYNSQREWDACKIIGHLLGYR